MRRRRYGAIAAALALATACSAKTNRTGGVVLLFDSNLKPPQDFDAIHIEVRHGPPDPIYDDDSPVRSLPQTFGIYAGGDLSIPIAIHTVALLRGQPRVTRDARTLVPRDRLVMLPMYLDAVCLGIVCPDGQTCDGGVCKTADVDSGGLSDYTPPPAPGADAGCVQSPCEVDAGPIHGGIDVSVAPTAVQAGHTATVDVALARQDDQGDAVIAAAGLPANVTADALTIPSGARSGALTLHADVSAAPSDQTIVITARDATNGRDGAAQVALTVTPGGPGRVDSSFGNGGHTVLPAAHAAIAAIRSTGTQIVVAGSTKAGSGEAFVARLDAGGAPIAGFGAGGVAIVSAAGAEIAGRALAIDAGGAAMIAGRIDDGTRKQLLVARFGDKGIDTSFNGSGLAIANVDDADVAGNAITFDDGGNIVIAGEGTKGGALDTVLARFAPDGTADAAYTRLVDLGAGSDDFATAIAVEPARVVIGGVVRGGAASGPNDGQFLLAAFDAKGNADASFGSSGITRVDLGSDSRLASLFTTSPVGASAGSLLAAGRAASAAVAADAVGIAACAPDGSGASSKLLTSPFGARTVGAARDGAGRFVAAGVAPSPDGPMCVVSRFAAALEAPDPAFVTYTVAMGPSADTCAVAIAPDDGVLVAITGLAGEIVVTRLMP